jgi:hypothetical protein
MTERKSMEKIIVLLIAVLLTWNDTSNNEDGFVVQRDGVIIGYTAANVHTFTDPVVIPQACYKVAAFNNFGQSSYANVCLPPPPQCVPKGKSGKCR